MNKEEFKTIKEGAIVYKINTEYNINTTSKGIVVAKDANSADIELSTDTYRVPFYLLFSSEEKAKEEIIRRYKDGISLRVSEIRRNMRAIASLNKDALDDKFLNNITNSITSYYKVLKEGE